MAKSLFQSAKFVILSTAIGTSAGYGLGVGTTGLTLTNAYDQNTQNIKEKLLDNAKITAFEAAELDSVVTIIMQKQEFNKLGL